LTLLASAFAPKLGRTTFFARFGLRRSTAAAGLLATTGFAAGAVFC
jgi:hypothetical protein